MSHRLFHLLQILSLAMLAWLGLRLLGRVHPILGLVVVVFAGCNVMAVWLIRHGPRVSAAVYARPVARQYMNWVCWCTGDQPPAGRASKESKAELLLHSERDFHIAAYRAKQAVRGHDHVIDRLLSGIHGAVTLRTRRRGGDTQPPLASFLLVGGQGVGKRYLARVLAKLLYQSGGALVFECDRVTSETLVGTQAAAGELLEAVRRQPFQVIIFDGIDAASPDLMQVVSTILTRGAYGSPHSNQAISFQNTTVVMTTEKAASALAALEERSLSEGARHQQALDALTAETLIDHALLNAVSDVIVCHGPTDLVKAEVVALLMKKEAAAHGLDLSRVDPEVLAAQVVQIDDATGFGLVPERMKKFLRKPLVAAAQHDHRLLSLRVRRSPVFAPGNKT